MRAKDISTFGPNQRPAHAAGNEFRSLLKLVSENRRDSNLLTRERARSYFSNAARNFGIGPLTVRGKQDTLANGAYSALG